jgi:hypothetical protein
MRGGNGLCRFRSREEDDDWRLGPTCRRGGERRRYRFGTEAIWVVGSFSDLGRGVPEALFYFFSSLLLFLFLVSLIFCIFCKNASKPLKPLSEIF